MTHIFLDALPYLPESDDKYNNRPAAYTVRISPQTVDAKSIPSQLFPIFCIRTIFCAATPWYFERYLFNKKELTVDFKQRLAIFQNLQKYQKKNKKLPLLVNNVKEQEPLRPDSRRDYKTVALTSSNTNNLFKDATLQWLLELLPTAEFIYTIIRKTGSVPEDQFMKTLVERTPRLTKIDPLVLSSGFKMSKEYSTFSDDTDDDNEADKSSKDRKKVKNTVSEALVESLRAVKLLASSSCLLSRSLVHLRIFMNSQINEVPYAFFVECPTDILFSLSSSALPSPSSSHRQSSILSFLAENLHGLRRLEFFGLPHSVAMMIADRHEAKYGTEEKIELCKNFYKNLLDDLAPLKGRLENFDHFRYFNEASTMTGGSRSNNQSSNANLINFAISSDDCYRLGVLFGNSLRELDFGAPDASSHFQITDAQRKDLLEFSEGCSNSWNSSSTISNKPDSRLRTLSLRKVQLDESSAAAAAGFKHAFENPQCFKFVSSLDLSQSTLCDDNIKVLALNCVFLESLDLSFVRRNLTAKAIEYICIGETTEKGDVIIAPSVIAETLRSLHMRNFDSSSTLNLSNDNLKSMSVSLFNLVELDIEYSFGMDEDGLRHLVNLVENVDGNVIITNKGMLTTKNDNKDNTNDKPRRCSTDDRYNGSLRSLRVNVEVLKNMSSEKLEEELFPLVISWSEYFI